MRGRPPIPAEKRNQIRELHVAGVSATDIGRMLGVHRNSVFNIINGPIRTFIPTNAFNVRDLLAKAQAKRDAQWAAAEDEYERNVRAIERITDILKTQKQNESEPEAVAQINPTAEVQQAENEGR